MIKQIKYVLLAVCTAGMLLSTVACTPRESGERTEVITDVQTIKDLTSIEYDLVSISLDRLETAIYSTEYHGNQEQVSTLTELMNVYIHYIAWYPTLLDSVREQRQIALYEALVKANKIGAYVQVYDPLYGGFTNTGNIIINPPSLEP